MSEGVKYDGTERTELEFRAYVGEREKDVETLPERIREIGNRTELKESDLEAINIITSQNLEPARKKLKTSATFCVVLLTLVVITNFLRLFPPVPWDAIDRIAAMTILISVLFALRLISEYRNYKSKSGFAAKRTSALENKEYEAYEADITKKTWCKSSLYEEEFLVECGEVNVFMDRKNYETASGKIIFVLLESEFKGKKRIEVLVLPCM